MKKIFKTLFAAAAVVAGSSMFQACGEGDTGIMTEIPDISFYIVAVDSNNESLFDPGTDVGRYFLENVNVSCDGTMFPVCNIDAFKSGAGSDDPAATKGKPQLVLEKLAHYDALQKDDFYCLALCGFEGAKNYADMIIMVDWPDPAKSHNKISYSRIYDNSGKTPKITEYIHVDDDDNPTCTILRVFNNPGSFVPPLDPQ